jgi:predicted Rossmann fold flavoprotein
MTTVIIGAGPAGLMAAGSIDKGRVIVVEKNEKAGKKLYITGKGRCNVTNDCGFEKLISSVVSNPKFLYSAFKNFSPQDAVEFFKENGVPLKTERGGRVFPVSDKASDITAALVKRIAKNPCAEFMFKSEVKSARYDAAAKVFRLTVNGGKEIACENLVIATGGLSYPATGSTGDGYKLALSFGHTVSKLRPALVHLILAEDVKSLEGLSLENAAVKIEYNSVSYKLQGEMLFTSDGVSGPVILSLSSLLSRDGFTSACTDKEAGLYIDLKPALSAETLDKRILRDFNKYLNKQLKNALFELLPKSIIPYIIKVSGLNGDSAVNSVTKEERLKLLPAIKNLGFTVKDLGGTDKGIVTGGGVSVGELNPKTLESKLVPGLYFAGEIIDADALTGGFNIQIALSTGFAAGTAINNKPV